MRPDASAWVLALSMCVLAVHAIDRNGFSVVLEPIKHDMSLSDTQLGLLAGPAFALFNAAAALPLARLADRYGRRSVLAACLLLWSGCTALAGIATSFARVALARGCLQRMRRNHRVLVLSLLFP